MTARNDVLEKIAHLRRRSYRPVLERAPAQPDDCLIGGAPSEATPCSACDAPRSLALQLNPMQLPEPLRKEFGDALIRLLVCSAPSCTKPHQLETATRSSSEQAAPVDIIRGWTVVDDYPTAAEIAGLGVALENDESIHIADFPTTGDKLSGWPRSRHNSEPVACSQCSKPMRLIFQLASGAAPGTLVGCRTHKDQLAFITES